MRSSSYDSQRIAEGQNQPSPSMGSDPTTAGTFEAMRQHNQPWYGKPFRDVTDGANNKSLILFILIRRTRQSIN
jgi:hypothetical protein